METITTINSDRTQPTPLLWTPLPECQQEMLSGGAPKINGGGKGSSDTQ